jgi:hypothetical protein
MVIVKAPLFITADNLDQVVNEKVLMDFIDETILAGNRFASARVEEYNGSNAIGFGQRKAILFSMSVDLGFQMDFTGNLGAGPNTLIIPFQTLTQGKQLEYFLKSEEYKIMVLATKTSRQYLKIALIEYLILTKIINSSFKNNKTRKYSKIHKIKTRKNKYRLINK